MRVHIFKLININVFSIFLDYYRFWQCRKQAFLSDFIFYRNSESAQFKNVVNCHQCVICVFNLQYICTSIQLWSIVHVRLAALYPQLPLTMTEKQKWCIINEC